jgi:hypothetical protein
MNEHDINKATVESAIDIISNTDMRIISKEVKKVTFRELLQKKDIRGAQLGRKLGRGRATVSRWMCGHCPPAKLLTPIAKALDITESELLSCFNQD